MRGVVTPRGTGPRAAFLNIQMDNAGKTGTTQEGRDLYHTGSTPHLTASVWIGHDQPKPLTTNVTGGQHRPDTIIWRYVMEQIHIELGLESRIFERPSGFTYHTVCATSGHMPLPGCPTRTELFAPGTVPNRPCHVHVSYTINIVTGMIPCQWCTPEQIRSGIGIVRDRSWMEVAGNVSLPDSGQEVPRAVRENIICNVHGPHGTGFIDYSHIDFDDPDLDPDVLDLINNLLHGSGDPDGSVDDSQYQYPHGNTADTDTDNPPPFMPGGPTPTPTPMPERTPIALPLSPTPTPTQAPVMPGNPGVPPPGNPGTPPPAPPDTGPGFRAP